MAPPVLDDNMSTCSTRLAATEAEDQPEKKQSAQSSQGLKLCESATSSNTPFWPREGKRRSRVIDEYLAVEWKKRNDQPKVMLLGFNDQIILLWKHLQFYSASPTKEELEEGRKCLQDAFLNDAEYIVLEALDETAKRNITKEEIGTVRGLFKPLLGPEASFEDRARRLSFIYHNETVASILAKATVSLSDLEVKRGKRRPCPHGHGSLCNRSKPFIEQLEQFSDPKYQCDMHDWLHIPRTRLSMSTVQETIIERNNNKTLTFLNIRSTGERRKWVHVLDNVDCCVYPADLASYDTCVMEDCSRTYFEEGLSLFDSICNSKYLLNMPIVVVFTNIAALRETLRNDPSNFRLRFPSCEAENFDEILDFLKHCFMDVLKDRTTSSLSFTRMEVMNSQAIERVFDCIEESICGYRNRS